MNQTSMAAVVVTKHMWPANSVLNVAFLDGEPVKIELVKRIASRWLDKTSLSFRFFHSLEDAPAKTHIRISFKHHSGSQLGDQNNNLSKYPTMNLFDLTSSQISDSGAKRLILHEFGHALGFAHEFRNPNWPHEVSALSEIINLCVPKIVFIGYSTTGAEKHCEQINRKLTSDDTLSTAYDQSSVMNYALNFINQHGKPIKIDAKAELSFLDKYAIQKWYPQN